MTEEEFDQVRAALKSMYPNANIMPDVYTIRLWYRMLADLDYIVVETAVLDHASTCVFPPSIAEIRQKCAQCLNPMVTDWGVAWEEVQGAIRRYGYYREEEAVASLSRMTATIVKRMGFRNLCMSDNPVADRAHFQRMYEGIVKEEQNRVQLPQFVRQTKDRLIEEHIPQPKVIEQKDTQSLPVSKDEDRSLELSEHVQDLLEGLKRKMHVI